MPQDPLTLAIIGGVFLLLAQVVGQTIGAIFGTRAAAHINQLGQERIAREKDRREWRRTLIQPLLEQVEERRQLFVELGRAMDQEWWREQEEDVEFWPPTRPIGSLISDLLHRDNIFVKASFRVASSRALEEAYDAYERTDRGLLTRLVTLHREGAPILDSTVGQVPEHLAQALVALHRAAERDIYGEDRATTPSRWNFWRRQWQ
jgi:hypothetical protein